MKLEYFPRVALGFWPTPLEPAKRLSEALGGPEIWIKRDDLSGLAMGGNKVRKLEFILAEALAQGADVVLTAGSAQSNHARQTAAACARFGLPCILILRGDPAAECQGSLLLDNLLGAEVRIYGGISQADRERIMYQVANELRAAGRRPYVIPVGGSCGLGALGHALAVKEIADQAEALGLKIDVLITSSSSGGTQAGLILGQRLYNLNWQVWGISADLSVSELATVVAQVANQGARLLGMDEFNPKDVIAYDDWVGPGYGVMTQECREAILLLARTEGILLDPVYTGKAMAGLINLACRGLLSKRHKVLFLHTGGTPALFAYRAELLSAQSERH